MDSKDQVQESSLHPDELETRKRWAWTAYFHWLSVCLVALCDAGLVGCIAACSIRSSQACSRSHQVDGRIRTCSCDDMAPGNREGLRKGVSPICY